MYLVSQIPQIIWQNFQPTGNAVPHPSDWHIPAPPAPLTQKGSPFQTVARNLIAIGRALSPWNFPEMEFLTKESSLLLHVIHSLSTGGFVKKQTLLWF
jgi:hypothetical protein